jgi:hypothetical protein
MEAHVAWWQRLFSREKTAATPHAATLVRGVVMTMPDWHEDAPSGAMRTWHNPDGGVLSLAVASGGAIPPPSRVDLLRNALRRLAEASGAGLVEANAVPSAYGPAARMIYKRRQEMAFVFTGMLLLPAGERWLVCTVVDAERGTTGVREAVVTAELMQAGQFPEHPLSRVRRTLDWRTCSSSEEPHAERWRLAGWPGGVSPPPSVGRERYPK